MDFKTMTIEDIITWCQQNNQIDWLKAEAQKTTQCKVYPRKRVEKTVAEEDGSSKIIHSSVADKTQAPVIKTRPITFVQIKKDFAQKFMPGIMKGSNKKPTMYEIIANL